MMLPWLLLPCLDISGDLRRHLSKMLQQPLAGLLLITWADTAVQDMTELHRVSGEKRAAVAANKPAGVECQPNAAAPLLRDEKARREWVEHELDMCCQVSTHKPCTRRGAAAGEGPLLPILMPSNAKSSTLLARSCTCCCWCRDTCCEARHEISDGVSASGAAQSFELARVLDGEKAMRTEAARRKADVDRRLAQAAADSAGAAALQAEQSALNAQLQQHSGQVRAAPQRHISATVPSVPWHPAVSSTGISLAFSRY